MSSDNAALNIDKTRYDLTASTRCKVLHLEYVCKDDHEFRGVFEVFGRSTKVRDQEA